MDIMTDSLHRQVYEIVRQKILNQELVQGEMIETKRIAAECNISVSPVRNALQELTDYGLAVKKERVGYFVRKFTHREIQEIQNVRKMYEIYCLEKYFNHIDREGLAQIVEMQKEASLEKFYTYDVEMHALIIKASNNEFLMKQYAQVQDFFWLFMFIDKNIEENHIAVSKEEHELILNSILDNDKQTALQLLNAHLDRVGNEAIMLLKED